MDFDTGSGAGAGACDSDDDGINTRSGAGACAGAGAGAGDDDCVGINNNLRNARPVQVWQFPSSFHITVIELPLLLSTVPSLVNSLLSLLILTETADPFV